MKRIFIAVKIEESENLRNLISLFKSGLSNEKIKWTDPDNIHVTLAFIGDAEEKLIGSLDHNLKEKCDGSGQFEITLNGFGVFKNLRDPRILWVGIDHSEELLKLNGLVIEALTRSGIKIEDKPFSPHITIGRVRNVEDKNALKRLLDEFRDRDIQKMAVREVTLYESIIRHEGPVYRSLEKYNL